MRGLHADKVFAPLTQLVVSKWDRRHRIFEHDGVRLSLATVGIKLFLEEFVDGFVDIERRTGWSGNLQADVEPETTRALHEKLDLAARHLERCLLSRLVRLTTFPPIIIRHYYQYNCLWQHHRDSSVVVYYLADRLRITYNRMSKCYILVDFCSLCLRKLLTDRGVQLCALVTDD